MTDPSLNRRLDHHARRSGFAIGASMALTIALLIGGFVWLFAMINPYLSDFLGAKAAPNQTPTAQVVQAIAQVSPAPTVSPTTAATVNPVVTPTAAVASSAAPSANSSASSRADAFTADYEIGPVAINFRASAGTTGAAPIDVLNPGRQLQSTGRRETVDGSVWLELTDEEGRTGWIREIDMRPI
jgi:hypothetical protein